MSKIESKMIDVFKSELDFRNKKIVKRWGEKIIINILFMEIAILIGLMIRRL